MSRVAAGYFRKETRSALDIEGKHVTIQGPSPDLSLARNLHPMPPLGSSVLRYQFGNLRVQYFIHTELRREMSPSDRSGSARPRPCAVDRDWSAGPVWPSRLMPGSEVPFRAGRLAAPAKAAC